MRLKTEVVQDRKQRDIPKRQTRKSARGDCVRSSSAAAWVSTRLPGFRARFRLPLLDKNSVTEHRYRWAHAQSPRRRSLCRWIRGCTILACLRMREYAIGWERRRDRETGIHLIPDASLLFSHGAWGLAFELAHAHDEELRRILATDGQCCWLQSSLEKCWENLPRTHKPKLINRVGHTNKSQNTQTMNTGESALRKILDGPTWRGVQCETENTKWVKPAPTRDKSGDTRPQDLRRNKEWEARES